MKPEYDKLFQMDDPLASQPFRLSPYDYESLTHLDIINIFQGRILPSKPIKLRPRMGGRFMDLMWSTYPPITVISLHLKEILTANNLTGWNTYPIEVHNKAGEIIPDYFGFSITGKAGRHDLHRVQVIEKPPVVPNGPPYNNLKGFYFENDEWDGSDFCVSSGVVVTQKVVQVFKKAKIKNVRFIQLPDFEIGADVYEVRGLWPLKK
jgi:hypothetical protein